MSATYQGACLCGSVTFTCDAEANFSGHCHCTDCQKFHGTGHNAAFIVPRAAVNMQGELASFTKKSDAGNDVTRYFCPACGSPMLLRTTANEDIDILFAGTLDDPGRFSPEMNFYMDSAHPWDAHDDSLHQAPKGPGSGRNNN